MIVFVGQQLIRVLQIVLHFDNQVHFVNELYVLFALYLKPELS